ncbi:MAG: hypothetical protein HQRvContig01_35 [Haloquadratum phage sp.]|nr:MAG: hypothetical protein HQRvContig01_35 [Haloquadratum phage sp.]
MRILHCFADTGAENPCLSRHGDVVRLGLDAKPNQWSQAITADANQLPIQDGVTFDMGWFHPPCGGVSPMSDTGSGSREDWPDLIPVAREIAEQHCDRWVIENKPRDSLDAEVTLTGHMFNLGIEYERAFETSFPVEQPARQSKLADTSPFYYSEKSRGWWASVKGSSTTFSKAHLAKNTIPTQYIEYIMRHYYEHTVKPDLPDYSQYDKEKETERRQTENDQLDKWC